MMGRQCCVLHVTLLLLFLLGETISWRRRRSLSSVNTASPTNKPEITLQDVDNSSEVTRQDVDNSSEANIAKVRLCNF